MEMQEETVTIRCDRRTRKLLRLLAAHWDVSIQEALRRIVEGAWGQQREEESR